MSATTPAAAAIARAGMPAFANPAAASCFWASAPADLPATGALVGPTLPAAADAVPDAVPDEVGAGAELEGGATVVVVTEPMVNGAVEAWINLAAGTPLGKRLPLM